jgi:CubicO group peptidase (beta-lactamase class C family)
MMKQATSLHLSLPWATLLGVILVTGCARENERPPAPEVADQQRSIDVSGLDHSFTEQLPELHIPGLSVAIVDKTGILFASGYGWADLEARVPMSPDSVLNIASISKTVTALAVLQLRDQGLLALDEDVNKHLPFEVRNPAFPDAEITLRHLLTHTSGITDGEAYDASYACGDPAIGLADWIRGYLEPGGRFYDADQNFLATAPGEERSYSNVGFGLLGYLVEVVSGVGFADFVESSIFEPLGMSDSSFYLSDGDRSRHATPYAWIEAGDTLDNPLFGERNGEVIEESGFVPFCLYSFYNIPDGLVRTSAHDLARFLIAHLRGGELDGQRVVAESTILEMLSPQLPTSALGEADFDQGLAWRHRTYEGGGAWGHGGGDPGVRTYMMFSPEAARGVIVVANRAGNIDGLLDVLAEVADLPR